MLLISIQLNLIVIYKKKKSIKNTIDTYILKKVTYKNV